MFKYLLKKLTPGKWEVVLKLNNFDSLNDLNKIINAKNYSKILAAPFGYYWADPFIIEDKLNLYLFIEEYSLLLKRGCIRCISFDKNLNLIDSKIIIFENFHLSYPNIILVDDVYYIIPESHEKMGVFAYKCNKFPFDWEFSHQLISNVDLVDCNLIETPDSYFLFGSCIGGEGKDGRSNTMVFNSKSFFSTFSPDVSNILKGRNAGNLFNFNKQIFRPTQISEHSYGEKILIKNLNFCYSGIVESNVIEIKSNYFSVTNIHTINFSNSFLVFDRKRISLLSVFESYFYFFIIIFKSIKKQYEKNNFFW